MTPSGIITLSEGLVSAVGLTGTEKMALAGMWVGTGKLTMAGVYLTRFTAVQNLEFCLRLFLSFLAGGMVGIERSRRFKEAGVRTHILVCCTGALIMLISKYGFADLSAGVGMEYFGTRGADAARVAAQAVSGISFLCAGVIFKDGGTVKGLTTAAGIWLTAAIGLGIGAGMYVVTGFALVLIYVFQHALYRMPVGSDAYEGSHVHFLIKEGVNSFDDIVDAQLKEWKAQVIDSTITWHEDGTVEYDFVIRTLEDVGYPQIKAFVLDHPEIISASSNALHAHLK